VCGAAATRGKSVAAAVRHPARLGDARELPDRDSSADVVLLFGPLYHLPSRADRLAAWREAARVVRPGGLVVAATISRFASLFDGVAKGFYARPDFRPLVEGALADGVHFGTAGLFTTAYFHRPEEPAREAAEAGLTGVRTVAVEGPVWIADERVREFLEDPVLTRTMLDMLRRVEDEPSLLGASSHLLTVGRRE
jgi:SAM-dependent methyltransferase